MMGIGYFLMKKLVFDLVDEVWDDGHALVVKNGGRDERIAFTDIKNVNYSPFVNPPHVTLSLRRQTSFGDQITFCAPVRFIPLTASPVITALIDRIDQARRKRFSRMSAANFIAALKNQTATGAQCFRANFWTRSSSCSRLR
jgi:hypothetical protein